MLLLGIAHNWKDTMKICNLEWFEFRDARFYSSLLPGSVEVLVSQVGWVTSFSSSTTPTTVVVKRGWANNKDVGLPYLSSLQPSHFFPFLLLRFELSSLGKVGNGCGWCFSYALASPNFRLIRGDIARYLRLVKV